MRKTKRQGAELAVFLGYCGYLKRQPQMKLGADSIAFSVTATQKVTQIFVHYYVEKEQRFYMSFVDKIWNTYPVDIQRCHNIVKNILEYGITVRQQRIKDALSLLYPIPDHWNQARPTGSPSTKEGSRLEDN
jgi:hypothetical protein